MAEPWAIEAVPIPASLVKTPRLQPTRKAQKAFRPSQPDQIEAPAKHIHIVSEEIKAPQQPDDGEQPEDKPQESGPKDGDDSAPEQSDEDKPDQTTED